MKNITIALSALIIAYHDEYGLQLIVWALMIFAIIADIAKGVQK